MMTCQPWTMTTIVVVNSRIIRSMARPWPFSPGDALLTHAFEVLSSPALTEYFPATLLQQVSYRVARASGSFGMIGGQVMDIVSEGKQVPLEVLEYIHRHKTAALLTASVTVGGLLGGGSHEQVQALERYGHNVGWAFQIADDLLDVEGDAVTIGKQVGRDAVLEKVTYPALLGVEPSRQRATELMQKALPPSPILARVPNASDKSRPILSPATFSMAARERLDVLVWQRGLAPSRAKAHALILAGQIAVNGERTTRAGAPVDLQATVTRLGAPSPYVSRGGEKLAAALAAFDLTVHQRVAMDVGASTGGFTDCLLQAGALRVYAVDVGYGQLHWRLRTDPCVIVHERTNARYLQPEDVPERIGVLTVDVSFISLRLLLPVLVKLLEPQADSVVLIKPQFEVGKGQVGKSGVVHDPQQHQQVLWDILTATQDVRVWGTRSDGVALARA